MLIYNNEEINAGYYILWISKSIKSTGCEIRDIKCSAFIFKVLSHLFLILHSALTNVYNTLGEIWGIFSRVLSIGYSILAVNGVNCQDLSVKIMNITRLLKLLKLHGRCYFFLINFTLETANSHWYLEIASKSALFLIVLFIWSTP